MEKVQLQLIIEKLAKFTRQDRSVSIHSASQQKLQKPSRKQGHKKSQSAAAAPPGESAQDRLAGILDPLDEEQKTEEQKEMEKKSKVEKGRYITALQNVIKEKGLQHIGASSFVHAPLPTA